MNTLDLLRFAAKKSLPSVLGGLRYHGLGAKIAKKSYTQKPDCYWIITGVKLNDKRQIEGATGTLIWNGRIRRRDSNMADTDKRQWVLLKVPDYSKFRGKQQQCQAMVELIGGDNLAVENVGTVKSGEMEREIRASEGSVA